MEKEILSQINLYYGQVKMPKGFGSSMLGVQFLRSTLPSSSVTDSFRNSAVRRVPV